MANSKSKKPTTEDLLMFAEARIADHNAGAAKLGDFLQRYFPGAHVECERLEDTCIRLLRGHRRALSKLKYGWNTEIESKKE